MNLLHRWFDGFLTLSVSDEKSAFAGFLGLGKSNRVNAEKINKSIEYQVVFNIQDLADESNLRRWAFGDSVTSVRGLQ